MSRKGLEAASQSALTIVVGPDYHPIFDDLDPAALSGVTIVSFDEDDDLVPRVDANGNMPVCFSLRGEPVPLSDEDVSLVEQLSKGTATKKRTVWNHIEDLRQRVGGGEEDRAALVAKVMMLGLVTVDRDDSVIRRPSNAKLLLGMLVSLGYANQAIADMFGKRVRSTANHVSEMNELLGIPSRDATFPRFVAAGLFHILPPRLVAPEPESAHNA